MLQPRVMLCATVRSNCAGLCCIIWAASLFSGSSGLGACRQAGGGGHREEGRVEQQGKVPEEAGRQAGG
jgi:hypothetical protein